MTTPNPWCDSELLEKRMARVHAINSEESTHIRERLECNLYAWMEGLRDARINTGRLLMASDWWQMENGNDGPMCGGVFTPSHPKYVQTNAESMQ